MNARRQGFLSRVPLDRAPHAALKFVLPQAALTARQRSDPDSELSASRRNKAVIAHVQ